MKKKCYVCNQNRILIYIMESFVLKVLVIIITGMIAMFSIKKLIESLINLIVDLKNKNKYDNHRQREGMVLNKKTKKLEADQSLILPFE